MSRVVAEEWDDRSIGQLFRLQTSPITPGVQPDQGFHHHSLPAYDEFRGPALDRGRSIESVKIHIKRPALLVSKLNPRIPRVSLVADLPANQVHCASTEFMVLEPTVGDVDLAFFHKVFLSESFRQRLMSVATGTTGSHTRVSPKQILKWQVPLPSLGEQQKIAEILDAVDESIRSTERFLDKLDVFSRSLVRDQLGSGGLPVASLGDVCSLLVDCPHTTPIFRSEGVLVARTSNIRNGRFTLANASRVSEAQFRERTIRATPASGDIIFTREAPVGEAFIVPSGMKICLGQRTMLLRVDKNYAVPEFILAHIYFGAVASVVRKLTAGTTNPHLNVKDVRKISVPLPSLDEQGVMAKRLETVELRQVSLLQELNKLRSIKRGLMEDLLAGWVRV